MFKKGDIVRLREGRTSTLSVPVKREHLLIVLGISNDHNRELEYVSEDHVEGRYLRVAYLNEHTDHKELFSNVVYSGPKEFRDLVHGVNYWNASPTDVEKL